MKKVPLSRGMFALVDDSDYEAVIRHRWFVQPGRYSLYAARRIKTDGKRRLLFLHRFLLPESTQIDHKNGDGLDNRRDNIRPCDHRTNNRGLRRKASGSSSRFRGVFFDKGKWVAQIRVDRARHLGYFTSEVLAAEAYDAAARKYFGEFASPNFPKPQIERKK